MMKRFQTIACSGVLAAAACIAADTTVEVSAAFEVAKDAASGKVTLAPSTVAVLSEPGDLPTPQFHFDATRTNDWTFNAARTQVTKIPSLVGERYLASSLGDGDAAQLGNGSISAALWMPGVDALGGLPAIDLGAKNSTRGLFFDPIDNDGSIDITYTKVNVMTGKGRAPAPSRRGDAVFRRRLHQGQPMGRFRHHELEIQLETRYVHRP